MAKRVTVTGAEQSAARNIIKRNTAKGVTTRSSVTKIANARSSSTGRHLSASTAARKPQAS